MSDTIDHDTGEITEHRTDALVEFGNDEIGLERATDIATRLDGIVKKNMLSVNIQGLPYLKVEAWCALASMVGLAPRTAWTKEARHPTSGDLEGYEARVEVIRIATGEVIGCAEAGCFYDEKMKGQPRWTERHALKSMAQTRAASKAIAQLLRWIPILAGYKGTPAEEMPRETRGYGPPPKISQKSITEKQAGLIIAKAINRQDELGLKQGESFHLINSTLKERGFKTWKPGLKVAEIRLHLCEQITKPVLDAFVAHIEKWTPDDKRGDDKGEF